MRQENKARLEKMREELKSQAPAKKEAAPAPKMPEASKAETKSKKKEKAEAAE